MPLNFHIGNMGLASYYPETVDSVPPAIHGGNVDDRRIGKGATMYYPVQVMPDLAPTCVTCPCMPDLAPACSKYTLVQTCWVCLPHVIPRPGTA